MHGSCKMDIYEHVSKDVLKQGGVTLEYGDNFKVKRGLLIFVILASK